MLISTSLHHGTLYGLWPQDNPNHPVTQDEASELDMIREEDEEDIDTLEESLISF